MKKRFNNLVALVVVGMVLTVGQSLAHLNKSGKTFAHCGQPCSNATCTDSGCTVCFADHGSRFCAP
jgi:hypothetical protein